MSARWESCNSVHMKTTSSHVPCRAATDPPERHLQLQSLGDELRTSATLSNKNPEGKPLVQQRSFGTDSSSPKRAADTDELHQHFKHWTQQASMKRTGKTSTQIPAQSNKLLKVRSIRIQTAPSILNFISTQVLHTLFLTCLVLIMQLWTGFFFSKILY